MENNNMNCNNNTNEFVSPMEEYTDNWSNSTMRNGSMCNCYSTDEQIYNPIMPLSNPSNNSMFFGGPQDNPNRFQCPHHIHHHFHSFIPFTLF